MRGACVFYVVEVYPQQRNATCKQMFQQFNGITQNAKVLGAHSVVSLRLCLREVQPHFTDMQVA